VVLAMTVPVTAGPDHPQLLDVPQSSEAPFFADGQWFPEDPELPDDTITMPVVGDRVLYSRGSGYLVGLQGVVVAADDDERALPPGLRAVQFDGEEWPTVVTVTALDRMEPALGDGVLLLLRT
jgi:hypothetical protein